MKSILRVITIVGFVISAGIIVAAVSYGDDVLRMPSIGAGFYAKEFCSCHFVNGQSEEFCRDLVQQYIPLNNLKIDASEKSVEASTLGATRKAQWVSERFGCVLNHP